MNLNMIKTTNRIENLLLTNKKDCGTLIHQTRTPLEETVEIKVTKLRQTFHFNPKISVEGSWMLGKTNLEVYISIFIITGENNNFSFYKFPNEKSGGLPYEKVRDEIEKDLDSSDITTNDLQDDILGPLIIEDYRKQVIKRMKDDKYKKILAGYTRCVFQVFESYLRTEVDLVEDDVTIVLDEFNSSSISYELLPGFYTFKDLSEVLFLPFNLNIQDLAK